LLGDGHVRRVKSGTSSAVEVLEYGCEYELASIDISNWTNTAMVGETTSMLESLEPLQTAVVKMSTVFGGVFTLADLNASMCSRWSGATYFDALRLFYAVAVLIARGIIDRVESNEAADEGWLVNREIECYRLNNMLIRRVGSALILESQRKIVLRQAMMDRILSQWLPTRMDRLREKKAQIHVPWYYRME